MRRIAMARLASALLISLVACSGGDDADDADDAAPDAAGVTPTTLDLDDASAPEAEVPSDCADLGQEAIGTALGGDAILDVPNSFYEDALNQLLCVYNTEREESEEVVVQLGAADDLSGFITGQEGTGTSDYVEVDGFDEARLYDDGTLIASRNGFAVLVSAEGVVPEPSEEQLVDIALEVTSSP